MYAYAHATLDKETFKLTGFSSGDKILLLLAAFKAWKVCQMFVHTKCLSFSKIWFVEHLLWLNLIRFYSFQISNLICCNLSINNMILLIKKIWK